MQCFSCLGSCSDEHLKNQLRGVCCLIGSVAEKCFGNSATHQSSYFGVLQEREQWLGFLTVMETEVDGTQEMRHHGGFTVSGSALREWKVAKGGGLGN